MCVSARTSLVAALLLGGPPAAAQSGPPIARIHITSSPSGAMVRVITPRDPWLAVLGGAPTWRRGDTLLVRAPARLQASLARHDVRIEAAEWPDLVVDADVTAGGRRRRLGAAARVVVLKAGGRAIETSPAARHRGIEELGGDYRPARVAFAPDPALSRAFRGGLGAWVSLSRPDTMVTLSIPCPAAGTRGAAGRVAVPGVRGVDARLIIGPGAQLNGLGAAVGFPVHPTTRKEEAIAGTVRVAGGCAVGDTMTVTVDSLIFPSHRLTIRRSVSLPISVPAP